MAKFKFPRIHPSRAWIAKHIQDENQARRAAAAEVPVVPTYIPEFLAEINDPTTVGAAYVKLGATYGYIAASSRLTIFNQLTMAIVGQSGSVANMNGNHYCELNAAETVAFSINEQGNCISSIDISNKAAPVVIQHFSGPSAGVSLAGATWAKRAGNLLFVACFTRDSIAIIDVSNPASMVWVGEFRGPTGGTSLDGARRVELDDINKICYWGIEQTGSNRLRLGAFSYADPANPVLLWSLATQDVDVARGVILDYPNNLLWVVSSGGSNADATIAYHGALTAYQINPANRSVAPTKIGQYRGYGSSHSVVTALSGARSVAFISKGGRKFALIPAETPNNITVLDVTDPTHIFWLGAVKDTAHLNQPMDIAIAIDGTAMVSGLANSGAVGRGVSKWAPHV